MKLVKKIGDVFAIDIDKKYRRYFQYLGQDSTQLGGHIIRVFIESIGVSTAATEYRVAAEVAKYIVRPMGWDVAIMQSIGRPGGWIVGAIATGAVANYLYNTFTDPATDVPSGP